MEEKENENQEKRPQYKIEGTYRGKDW